MSNQQPNPIEVHTIKPLTAVATLRSRADAERARAGERAERPIIASSRVDEIDAEHEFSIAKPTTTTRGTLKYPIMYKAKDAATGAPAALVANKYVAIPDAKLVAVQELSFGNGSQARTTYKASFEIKDPDGQRFMHGLRNLIVQSAPEMNIRPADLDHVLQYYFYNDKIDMWMPTRSKKIDVSGFDFKLPSGRAPTAEDFAAGLTAIIAFTVQDISISSGRLNLNLGLKMVDVVTPAPLPAQVTHSYSKTARKTQPIGSVVAAAPANSAPQPDDDNGRAKRLKAQGEAPAPELSDFPMPDAPAATAEVY